MDKRTRKKLYYTQAIGMQTVIQEFLNHTHHNDRTDDLVNITNKLLIDKKAGCQLSFNKKTSEILLITTDDRITE
jgi:hypothetical protein